MTLSFLSRCSSEHAVGIRTWHVRCEPWSRVLRGTDELQGVPMLYGLSVGIHLVYVDAGDPRILARSLVIWPKNFPSASGPFAINGLCWIYAGLMNLCTSSDFFWSITRS